MDSKEGKGWEGTKGEEDGPDSVGSPALGGLPDHMAGLVREIFGLLECVSLVAG
jgi:hypothetical protein